MFKFAKPNGDSYDEKYMGPIFAFDSGNDLIAICRGEGDMFSKALSSGIIKENEETHYFESDDWEEIFDNEDEGNPMDWQDWDIVMKMSNKKAHLLQHLLASAYNTLATIEKLCNPMKL
jgi:hypothetical protein